MAAEDLYGILKARPSRRSLPLTHPRLVTLAVTSSSGNELLARLFRLSPEKRLELHQRRSGPVMATLHQWLKEQLDERQVEPNSSLGKAIRYMLKHWEKLTLFLRVPGAPLDSNAVQRALKLAIRHRRNSLFYKTVQGAAVGDIYMSLISTFYLAQVDPFDHYEAQDDTAKKVLPAQMATGGHFLCQLLSLVPSSVDRLWLSPFADGTSPTFSGMMAYTEQITPPPGLVTSDELCRPSMPCMWCRRLKMRQPTNCPVCRLRRLLQR